MFRCFKFTVAVLLLSVSSNASQPLPSNYVKKTITQQINEQRAAYDELYSAFLAYQKNPENSAKPSDLHLAGFFSILKNAVALVNDHVNTLQLKPEDKEFVLKGLQEIYDQIVQSNEQKKITYEFSLRIAETLAHLEDLAKALVAPRPTKYHLVYFDGHGYKNAEWAYEYFENTYIKRTATAPKDNIEKDPTLRNLRGDKKPDENDLPRSKKVFSPTIVIYGDYQNQTAIPIKPFVDQAFAKPYTTGIALFDPLSEQWNKVGKRGTKKDAHYSSFNGTAKMFNHDLGHIFEKWLVFKEISNVYKIKRWTEALEKMNDLRVSLSGNPEKKNETIILENGLFILTHEILNVFRNTPGAHTPSQPTPIELIRSVSKNMQKAVDSKMIQQGYLMKTPAFNDEYKEYFRDHEFILFRQGVHDDEGAFVNFSEIKKSDSSDAVKLKTRQKQVINGYKRFWKKFEEIISEHITDPETHALIFGNQQNISNQDDHHSALRNSVDDDLRIALEAVPNPSFDEGSPRRPNSPRRGNNDNSGNNNLRISLEAVPNPSFDEGSPRRQNNDNSVNQRSH